MKILFSTENKEFTLEKVMYRNDLIRSKIVNMGLNKSTFADRSGLGLNTARKLWDGATNIELTSLKRAGEFLGIPLEQLFTTEDKPQEAQIS